METEARGHPGGLSVHKGVCSPQTSVYIGDFYKHTHARMQGSCFYRGGD